MAETRSGGKIEEEREEEEMLRITSQELDLSLNFSSTKQEELGITVAPVHTS